MNNVDPGGLMALKVAPVTLMPIDWIYEPGGIVYNVDCSSRDADPSVCDEGGGGVPPPCDATNPGSAKLTAAQQGMLGKDGMDGYTAPQQMMFLTITADMAALGVPIGGLTVSSVSIGAENYLELVGDTSALSAWLSSSNGFLSFPGDAHAGYDKSYRQSTIKMSMQIKITAGGIQVDIDPHNPLSLIGLPGHLLDIRKHHKNGNDTDYTDVANYLKDHRGIDALSGCN